MKINWIIFFKKLSLLIFVLLILLISLPTKAQNPQTDWEKLVVKKKDISFSLTNLDKKNIKNEKSFFSQKLIQRFPKLKGIVMIEVSRDKKQEIMEKIKKQSAVIWVEAEKLRTVQIIPNDPLYPQQWQYQSRYLPMESVWEVASASATPEPVLAVIDTGVDVNHEDLKNRLWINPEEIPDNGVDDDQNGYIDDVYGWNTYLNNNQINDDYSPNGHGTGVASLAAASSNNNLGMTAMNWQGKIAVLKVNIPGTGYINNLAVTKALEYAILIPNIKVINMSFGGFVSSILEEELINSIVEENAVNLVAAAGNNATSISQTPFYPASYHGVIAVSSYGRNNFSYFSNFGYQIDVAAPAESVYVAQMGGPYYILNSGTSFSSPIVAGNLLNLSHYPQLSALEKIQAIRNFTYCPLEQPNCSLNSWTIQYGFGRLNGEGSFFNRCSDGSFLETEAFISSPKDREIFTSQQTIEIRGTARSNRFQSYQIFWGRGDDANKATFSAQLVNPNQPKVNDLLARLDLSQFLYSDLYLIKLLINGDPSCRDGKVGTDIIGIKVNRQFKVSGWVRNLSGQPVAGVPIQFYKDGQGVGWVMTNSMGYYEKKDLSAGNYRFQPIPLRDETYAPFFYEVSLIEGMPDVLEKNFIQQTYLPTPTSTSTPTPIPTKTPTPTLPKPFPSRPIITIVPTKKINLPTPFPTYDPPILNH